MSTDLAAVSDPARRPSGNRMEANYFGPRASKGGGADSGRADPPGAIV